MDELDPEACVGCGTMAAGRSKDGIALSVRAAEPARSQVEAAQATASTTATTTMADSRLRV